MSHKRIYVDTSAYLSILLGEKEGAKLQRSLERGTILCSSTFLLLESERTLVRLVRERHLLQDDFDRAIARLRVDVQGLLLRDFTPDLAVTLEFPPARTPRSSDLVHLRTARWFAENGGLSLFLTADQEQSRAACEMSLPVVAA